MVTSESHAGVVGTMHALLIPAPSVAAPIPIARERNERRSDWAVVIWLSRVRVLPTVLRSKVGTNSSPSGLYGTLARAASHCSMARRGVSATQSTTYIIGLDDLPLSCSVRSDLSVAFQRNRVHAGLRAIRTATQASAGRGAHRVQMPPAATAHCGRKWTWKGGSGAFRRSG